MQRAIHDAPRSSQPSKYSEKARAEVIALACSANPEGRRIWTVSLIAEELRKRPGLAGINREIVRMILKNDKKTKKRRTWRMQTINEEYRRRMHDFFDLYSRKGRRLHIIAIGER